MEPTPTIYLADRVTRCITIFWNLVVHPTATFQQIRDVDAWTVLRWYLGALAFYTIMVAGLAYSGLVVTVPPSFVQMIIGAPPVHPSALLFPLFPIVVGANYMSTALYQSILSEIPLRVVFGWGATRGFGQTFKAIALSHIPWLILGWIPLLGSIASVPMLLYQVIGIRELHQISTKRALVAILLIPAILLMAILALHGIIYYFALTHPHS